ncbi:MAG: adenylate/guanylate cyclase domain-containing protein [Reyranella sp.]|uniref:adenylate/guanylate cyclase domain-containing protein n=1 Tax=Reyranella sp. TaxID=1929291 RepID=UPI00122AE3AF|nr:adenylate/guanylate cyclase domain-containing protein [Reyranella sp.]TAJ92809.1 MAG: adenylate/guanylate cyclase domain-containing protein [Reyranella sp.]TBR29046.1 MAG: adenylate/guanylate cyclase domain-containing protein [Reyranella sp.]
MKRKVGLFLLTVLIAVSLGATIVASLAMYRLVSRLQDEELRRIETSLSQRFDVFETMLRSENRRNTAIMAKVMPQIEADVERTGRPAADLTIDELNALSARYGVEHIYFIDRDHRVFNTNLAYDKGLAFPKGGFSDFLDSVLGKGRVMSDGIDLSSVTGTLRTYTYYGPPGKDYVIEASTDVRTTLKQSDFGWMGQYFFEDYFPDAVQSNAYVTDVDIYLINSSGTWSLIRTGEKLAPLLAAEVLKEGRLQVPDPAGRHVTIYSRYNRADVIKDESPLTVIRKVTYDLSLAREAVMHVFVSSMAVLALMLPLVYWLASRLLQRRIIDPILNLRGEAGAIAGGDLDHAIANTDRRDEIGHLARSFASMRDSVRSRINDLRETNLAIERFVPRAFLAKIGKPNIVSVALGDNKREHMTIMFSDIRNFTALSETMTPDENFAFINTYLEHVGPVIRDNGGFIDKYIGDAIMALFENADDGVRAGLAMLDALEGFNGCRAAQGLAPVAIGTGINTGSLMMGTIGELHRMDGTVISDAVNLAARIESLTKVYHVRMLISQYTYDHLADPGAYAIRPLDVVVVRGKTRPVVLFEVFDRDPPPEREAKLRTREPLLRGVEALLRHDVAAARTCFEECLALAPGDPAAANLLKSCPSDA